MRNRNQKIIGVLRAISALSGLVLFIGPLFAFLFLRLEPFLFWKTVFVFALLIGAILVKYGFTGALAAEQSEQSNDGRRRL